VAGTWDKTSAYRYGKGKGNKCWKCLKGKIEMVLAEICKLENGLIRYRIQRTKHFGKKVRLRGQNNGRTLKSIQLYCTTLSRMLMPVSILLLKLQ